MDGTLIRLVNLIYILIGFLLVIFMAISVAIQIKLCNKAKTLKTRMRLILVYFILSAVNLLISWLSMIFSNIVLLAICGVGVFFFGLLMLACMITLLVCSFVSEKNGKNIFDDESDTTDDTTID